MGQKYLQVTKSLFTPRTDVINNFTIKNVINRLKENDQTTANFTGFELVFLE